MVWLNSKFYKEVVKYFEIILDNNDDVEIIRDVLSMKTHLQDGGAFISNLISDMDIDKHKWRRFSAVHLMRLLCFAFFVL